MKMIRILYNTIAAPFIIIRIKLIQWRYKKITINNYSNQSNQNLAILILLQSKEYYFKQQLSHYGKYYDAFSVNEDYERYNLFMAWLFPDKDFKEFDIVIEYKPEAVTYYHNKIFKLNRNMSPNYSIEIVNQLKEWNK